MAKYRLLSAHCLEHESGTSVWCPGDKENDSIGDERGTVVGDGTPYRVKWPTLEMFPLDADAEKMLEKERKRLEANDASMQPVDDISLEDAYEANYVPAFNTRRKPPAPDGAPVGNQK